MLNMNKGKNCEGPLRIRGINMQLSNIMCRKMCASVTKLRLVLVLYLPVNY